MDQVRKTSGLRLWLAAACLAIVASGVPGSLIAGMQQSDSGSAPQNRPVPVLPRGQKLFLKDGSFHVVREYHIDGDRVRYYSVERSQWEEIPAALVDWDATKQAQVTQAQQDATLDAKLHKDEAARNAVFIDVDASVEVAPKVFLPEGEGLFVLDNLSVVPLVPAETDIQFNKTQLLKQILIPVPIVPTRHTVSLLGKQAAIRITNSEPEFYLRTKDQHDPEIYLIHARVRGDKRQIENLDQLFQIEMAKRESISIEKWELVKGVYRLTLSQPLPPGEYAFAEVVKAGEDELYVWDFGVDPGPHPAK